MYKLSSLFFAVMFTTTITPAQTDPIIILKKYQDEIKELGEHPKVQAAFDFIAIEEPNTLETHIALTEIEAPPFMEAARADAFKQLLEQAGIDSVWIDSVGNVLGLMKGQVSDRTIALDAHLDTVFPKDTDVKVKIKGDTLFAPGIGDDTRGLAMIVTIAKALKATGLKSEADLLFVGSVGEEGLGDLRGVKYLFDNNRPKIDSWISIDGGRIGRVNTQALGSYRYRIVYEGPGGHSWGAFGLVNPHHALGRAIDQFVIGADRFTKSGSRTSYNIGRIGGGTSINSVPFESWMEVDIRAAQPSRLDSMELILRRAAEEAMQYQNSIKRLGQDLGLRFEKIGDRPSGELPDTIPLVQRALGATAFLGAQPKITRGSTNSNIPIARGVPAVTIGRGGIGAHGHSLDEWWINRDGHKAIQLALLVLLAEANLE